MVATIFLHAQVMNTGFPNTNSPNNTNNGFGPNNQSDSAKNKLNKEWKEEQANIYFNYLNSAKQQRIDSSIEDFHHYQPVQPWWGADLGNYGTATRNQFFTPFLPSGLSLGYHVYDMYQLTADSMRFYNTTRPYSSFRYMLGSKSEQNAAIFHTQNINPFWNFAFDVKYNSAPGFYLYQKTNNLSFLFNTNYLSRNKRYYMAMGFTVSRFKQDENGGITDSSQLSNSNYSNRQLVEVDFPGKNGSTVNSAVNNQDRVLDFYIQNNYSFGKTDTLYTKDSTGMSLQFTPRFRIKHQFLLHDEKHAFKDFNPDTLRYVRDHVGSFNFITGDSVYSAQNWLYLDNKFSLNGFVGPLKQLIQIEAGIANRIDYFQTDYISGRDKQSSFGNYIFGEIKKEAFDKGQWEYQANANFFFTGSAIGNFNLNAYLGKDLGKWGQFSGGFKQNLSNAPYSYTYSRTNYYGATYSFDKASITQVWAKTNINKLNLELGVTNSLLANYLYYSSINDTIKPQQQSAAFSVLQIYGRKEFKFGIFRLDNEVAWQQATGGAPVHLPGLLLRERIGLVSPLFKSACIISCGLEAKYNTPYYSDGYSGYNNQFYYQDTYKISNVPQVLAYFNFKIKTFRAFVMFDQLQQLLSYNNINAPGYPAPSFLFRFGFNWVLIN